MNNKTGYFILSLDTELGLGVFDKDQVREKTLSPRGESERKAIENLLKMFEKYNIIATWAIVGHLFYKQCEECDICPMRAWKGRFKSFKKVYKTNNPLWYGADIVNMILSSKVKHEIAFHGYSHEIFDEMTMSEKKAVIEIEEYLRVAKRIGIKPKAIVFPRDHIGHLPTFEKFDFLCYRSEEKRSLLIRNKYFGKYLKTIDHILGISTTPTYSLSDFEYNGMVNLFASQHLFGFNRRIDRYLDSKKLVNLRIRRIQRGIKKAADENKIIHIWAHPWEFKTENDFKKLDYVLSCVNEQIQKSKMKSVGMTDMAKIIISQRNLHQ